MYKRTEDQRTGEQCNKRARGQENKITKSSGGFSPPLDVFSESKRKLEQEKQDDTGNGQEKKEPANKRTKWRAQLQPKRAPCKGRVRMTRKQEDKDNEGQENRRTHEHESKGTR